LLSLLLHRFRAAFPVQTFHDDPSSDRAVRQLMLLDVYWSFFIGLINFDPIRAMDYQARHKLLAARVGDTKRLSLSLAMEAASRAASGERDPNKIRDLIAKARALCEATESPEAAGLIATIEALCACVTGDWRATSRLAEEADRFLAERCSGVAWERATSIQLWDTAVFYLGEWRKLLDYAQRFPTQVEDAKMRGDVHAGVASFTGRTVLFLMSDQPMLAEQFVRDTIAVLPSNRYLMPKVWRLSLEVYIAMYAGDGNRAWSLVNAQWPMLTASQFLRVEYVAITALDIRGRAAIAAATSDTDPNDHLKEALKCARKLSRKRARWARAIGMLIRAGVASVRRQEAVTVQLLEGAEAEFRTSDMSHYVAACQYRRGILIGGDKGQALTAAAEAWANSQGVVDLARIFDMLAPGKWERV
jgi:hypothetical protein